MRSNFAPQASNFRASARPDRRLSSAPTLRKLLVFLLTAAAAAFAAGPAGAADSRIQVSVITGQLHVSNVVPTWGAQIPKVAYDGRWFYAVWMDSDDDAKYPWRGLVFKSPDAEHRTVAVDMRDIAATVRVVLSAFADETAATAVATFDDVGLFDG
jgi:hypothetical protein